ncbi:MAG: VOC family protein [Cyanobacteria bacterium]|nr:VOC family protein [Cyanobacteriota bacterium]
MTSATVTFSSITPNLLVRDVATSLAFYRDVLGFTMGETVPDKEPFVFVWLKRDDVSVFLNDIKAGEHDYPPAAAMPLKTQFYGMREFAITDPDGHIITFAERVSGQ